MAPIVMQPAVVAAGANVAWCSSEHSRRKKAAGLGAAGVTASAVVAPGGAAPLAAPAHAAPALVARPAPAPTANASAGADSHLPPWVVETTTQPRRCVRQGASVAEMRAEMVSLGFAAEATAAKGSKNVRAALQRAREAAPNMGAVPAASDAQVPAPRVIAEVVRVRWRGYAREYLVRYQDEECATSWVDEVALSMLASPALSGFDWDRMTLADGTDHSSSGGGSSSNGSSSSSSESEQSEGEVEEAPQVEHMRPPTENVPAKRARASGRLANVRKRKAEGEA